jgi:hypothetical protein
MTPGMMPVDWPLADTSTGRPVSPARRRAGAGRLDTVRADFFLDEQERLSDEERSLMSAMLRGLIAEVADELIAGMPALTAARPEHARDLAYRRLRNARLLDRPELLSLLLRRADEQQLSGRHEAGSDGVVAQMVADADPNVSAAAMALTLARGRRRDRFARLGLEFDDLSAEDAVAVVHATAAALRESLDDDADLPLAQSAAGFLSRHDEGRRLDAAVASLARVLDASGRAGDDTVVRLANEGEAPLLVALLSRRAGVDLVDGWSLFSGGQAMMLARMAGCARTTAAQILVAFEALLAGSAPEGAIGEFEQIEEGRVERCRQWMRLDPHYRAARDLIEASNG